jgi:hypothetical protein
MLGHTGRPPASLRKAHEKALCFEQQALPGHWGLAGAQDPYEKDMFSEQAFYQVEESTSAWNVHKYCYFEFYEV